MEVFESGGISNLAAKIKAWANATFSKTDTKYPKAIKSITRSGTTFTATHYDDTTSTFTQQDNNTTYGVVSKAANGLAPQLPNETATTKYLRQDGTWAVPPDNNTTYSAATQSAPGLMSAADKKKLDGIAAGAQANSVTGVKGNSESSYRTGNVNVTAANIGLGNVENKSSATIRGELTKDNVTTALGYTPPTTNTTYGVVSKTANGLAPQLPNETTTTKYLRQDGTWVVPPNTNTWTAFKGATTSAAGTAGYVPAPAAGAATRYFRSDGTWQVPPNTTYSAVSKTAAGLCPQLPNETTTTKYLRQDGTWVVPPNTNTWTAFKGATTSAAGTAGYVPAPAAGAATRYFRSDGTWAVPPDNNTTYSARSGYGIAFNGTQIGLGRTVLYNNASGTNGTVTLSASAANYNHMRVFYRQNADTTQRRSTDVYSPNGNKVVLLGCDGDNSGITTTWHKLRILTISGTSMATSQTGEAWIKSASATSANTGVSWGDAKLYVLRVEAWNE